MAQPACTEDEFIRIFNELASSSAVAAALAIDIRTVQRRKKAIEHRRGIILNDINRPKEKVDITLARERMQARIQTTRHSAQRGRAMEKGRVIVFSDAHFYPDETTTAYKALLECIKEFKPTVIVCNGDAFDGTTASRHARISWASAPTIKEELEACQFYMEGIEKANRGGELIWTLGNHDARFETFLSNQIGQYEGVTGFSLKDHFPFWKPCWSFWINDDTVIKHRWKGGWTAGRTNTLNAGVNIVTGHTHVLAVQPLTDYSPAFAKNGGTRYGVQTGTLADPNGDQFTDYTEANPKDWRSGFALLSFDEGRLIQPELIQVCGEDKVEFRGRIHSV